MKIKHRSLVIFFILLLISSCSKEESSKTFHQRVDKLMLEDKFGEAEKIAKSAYKKYPEDPDIICALASVYRNKALLSGVYPDDSTAGERFGKQGVFILEGKEPKAVFKEHSDYFKANNSKAKSLYYETIRIDSTYLYSYFDLLEDYALMADFDNYFKIVDLFIKNLKHDEKMPEYLVDLASRLVKRKYYAEALELYDLILKSFPNCMKAESDKGFVYLSQGKIPKANDIFKGVYAKDKKDLINLRNYIYSSILTEDFTTAYNLYTELIKHDKEHYGDYFNAGLLAYLLDKDYKKLFVKYADGRKNNAESIEKDFWYQNTLKFIEIENKDKLEKLKFFHFLMEQFGTDQFSQLTIITANIIEKFEVTDNSLIVRAMIFDKHKFFEKTIEYLDKIKERKKTDDSIIDDYNLNYNYGRVNYGAGNFEAAKKYFLKNFKEKKDDATLNYLLGVCYLELDETEEAKKYLTINAKMNDKDQIKYINYSKKILKNLEG